MRFLGIIRFVRLVWVVIPLVLFGVIGISESFSETNPENTSQLKWNIQDFYMSNNGNFEMSLTLDDAGNIPTEASFSCVACSESIIIQLENLNYVASAVFLEGFSEYREDYNGDFYKISFTDIIALNPTNSQIHYVGNYNTTLAFDTLRDPAEFSRFVWNIHWVRAFEDSDGRIYYQWLKSTINPILDEHFTSQEIFSVTKAFPDYTAKPYAFGGMDTYYVDNWFKANLLNETQIDTENKDEIKTGSFIVERFHYAFKVDYSITNGNDVVDIRHMSGGYDILAIPLQSQNNGTVTLSLPLELVNPSYCVDNPNYEFDAFYYSKSDPINYVILSEPNAETVVIEIPFSKYLDEVGIRYTDHFKWDEKPQCLIPENSDYSKLLSPKKQSKNIHYTQDIICKSDFKLVKKNPHGWSYCVTSDTAEKLIERGWATNENKHLELDNISNIINGCKSVGGTWLDDYNECGLSRFAMGSCPDGVCIEQFVDFCSKFNGNYNDCAGCRGPALPNVSCSAGCARVCEFN